MWLHPAFRAHDMTRYLVLSAFTSSPISLLATTKHYAFSLTVYMLPPNTLTSSALTTSWCVPFNFKLFWFTWTVLMMYPKAKLKSNSNRASPFFKPFLTGNMSDKFLPTQTLLHVSVRNIFIRLTSFMGITYSMRILYKTPFLMES